MRISSAKKQYSHLLSNISPAIITWFERATNVAIRNCCFTRVLLVSACLVAERQAGDSQMALLLRTVFQGRMTLVRENRAGVYCTQIGYSPSYMCYSGKFPVFILSCLKICFLKVPLLILTPGKQVISKKHVSFACIYNPAFSPCRVVNRPRKKAQTIKKVKNKLLSPTAQSKGFSAFKNVY